MARDEPESLWNFGEPEPWRRGRTILVTILCFYGALHTLIFLGLLLGGALEAAFAVAISLAVWWLICAFIWFGTHWVRWLLGAWTMLSGFAFFIWGIRDGSAVQWTAGVVNLLIGAFCFAPSVHFFAVRQKENILWPEKLVVAAVFVLLILCSFSTFVGVNVVRVSTERDAARYGEEALRRIFVEEDTAFLLGEATDVWKHNPHGDLRVTYGLTQKHMRLGYVENTRVTGVTLRSFYQFPAEVRYGGVVQGEGFAGCGQVLLHLEVQRVAERWRINGFRWQCLNTRTMPSALD